jgi:hypothetical protein
VPDRPAFFGEYPETLAAYLSAGGSPQEVARLLRDWGAITDEVGEVRSLDMTGDRDAEVILALIDPAPEFDLPWPVGDVLIFQCQAGAVVPVYQGRQVIEQDPTDVQFILQAVEDVNSTGRAEVVYVTSTCGAHTCWGRLFILEWDGGGFVNRASAMAEYPYPTFTVGEGKILLDVGGIGSAGAGYQRSYQESWAWDGRQFSLVEQITGPPTALVHFVHDGDDALAGGDYGEAIGHYRSIFEDRGLPAGLLLETEESAAVIVRAYARFKLVVTFAASGDGRGAQSQFEQMLDENPDGTPGYAYAHLGQVFWNEFLVSDSARSACAAAVTAAENDPTLSERLYAGYANPDYEPADLCRLLE